MKKILFATSALVAAGFASSAAAAEWETGVGGYMHAGVGLSSSNNQEGVGVVRDGEVYLNARLTADNGLVFRSVVQLEAWSQAGDQIDESYVSVGGSFGTLLIGGNDSAGYEMVQGLGSFAGAGAHIGYVDNFGITTPAKTGQMTVGVGRDAIGIHYYSPNYAGFQLGASYIPSIGADGFGDTNNFQFDQGADEAWSLAASYVGDFGDFGFGLGGHYTDIEGVAGEQFGFAANVGFSGFTIAGSFEDDFAGDEYAIGMQYQTGPWTIAAGYADSNQVNIDVAAGWVSYAMAPGVTFTTGVEWAEAGAVDDFGGVALISLSF